MATAAKHEQDPGTDLVATRTASIGILPPALQHALELRKLSNQIAGKIAELNWGQKLDLSTRRAIADWGRQYGVDPTTEVHVLGGNIYLNASYYLRRLAQLIEAGSVEYAYADHIEHDDRLDAVGGDGVGEKNRRLRERIAHQVPDKAQSAVVFRVKLRGMDREVVGVKWCGGGTRKNDPVGDAAPVETSESRAARRAMRLLVTHVPKMVDEVLATEESAELLSGQVVASRAAFEKSEVQNRIGSHSQMSNHVDPKDPYKLAPPSPDAVMAPAMRRIAESLPYEREEVQVGSEETDERELSNYDDEEGRYDEVEEDDEAGERSGEDSSGVKSAHNGKASTETHGPVATDAAHSRDERAPERTAAPVSARQKPAPESSAAARDELTCPKCGGAMWDNRSSKRNPKAPDYKCRSRSCDGVIWPPKPGESRAAAAASDDTDELPF